MAGLVVSGTEARDNAATDATTAGMAPALLEHLTVYLQTVIDDRRGALLDLCGGDMDTASRLIEHMETKRKIEARLAEIIEMEALTK
jgi:hypothetical protein